ncbi:hypothetical protein AA313_de0201602 [Arthrobotrys entomopaga]|nr:hypothetical protein AA313_de0201602 [Arthrobotrys entomopaga]
MHSKILYALLLTSGYCDASSQIRRRQQTVTVAIPQPKVLVGNGGAGPEIHPTNWDPATGSSTGVMQNPGANGPPPQPNGGSQINMIYPLDGPPTGSPPTGAPPNIDDASQPLAPPGDMGPAPLDTQGVQVPDATDVSAPPIDVNTADAVSALSDTQLSEIIKATDPEEFSQGSPEFQEYILAATKEKIDSVDEAADAYGIDPTEDIADPETAPTLEQYAEIQDLGQNLTEKAAMLSTTMGKLLDVAMDELRQNNTLDAPTDGSDGQGPGEKRNIVAIVSFLSLVYEGAKYASQAWDIGLNMYKSFKEFQAEHP